MKLRTLNEKLFSPKLPSFPSSSTRSQSATPEKTPESVKKGRRRSGFSIRSLGRSQNNPSSIMITSDDYIFSDNSTNNTSSENNYNNDNGDDNSIDHSDSMKTNNDTPTSQHPYRVWMSNEENNNNNNHNNNNSSSSNNNPNTIKPPNSTTNLSTLSTNNSPNSEFQSTRPAPFCSTPALPSTLIQDKHNFSPVTHEVMTRNAMTNSNFFPRNAAVPVQHHAKSPTLSFLTTTITTTINPAMEDQKATPSTAPAASPTTTNNNTTSMDPTTKPVESTPPPTQPSTYNTNTTTAATGTSTGIKEGPKEPLPRTAQEWKEKGAASAVRTEADSKGRVRTVVIKKGVEDFDFGKTLGNGSYSTVVCGSDKQTLRQYAIKILDKRHIIKEKKVKYVEIEKRTLNRLGDHPGIIPLFYTFQDEGSLYFVLDFASNGELLTLIKKLGSLSEECVRYYGAQLLDAIQFMHSRGVIHRDLKPENILLDDKMRIKVTDFGTAKLLNHERDAQGKELDTYPQNVRASSFVGTAEYVSPELLADKYVNKSCDIWAYGCIVYQMIAGRPPFKASNEYQTFQKIIKLQFSYPPQFSTIVRDLVKHILVLNPDRRYTALQIKQHHFFDGQDWSRAAIWKTVHPRLLPFRPGSRSASGQASNMFSGRISAPVTPNIPYSSNVPGSYFPRQQPKASKDQNANIPAATRATSSPNLNSNNVQQQQQHHSHAANANQAIYSAAAGAAAALAKPVSKISPYHTPTQPHTQPPQAPSYRPPTQQSNASQRSVARVAPSRIRTSASGPSSGPSGPNSAGAGTGVSAVPVVSPSVSSPYQQQSPVLSQPASQSPSTSQPPQPPIKPLEVPPLSQVDRELQALRVQPNERILKIGSVTLFVTNSNNAAHPSSPYADVHNQLTGSSGSQSQLQSQSNSNSDDEESVEAHNEKEPSRISRLFSGNRKKKRIMFITTLGRLVVISSLEEPRKVYLDLRVVAPQAVVRELAHNRRTNTGGFLVEAHNKLFTFEDPQGPSEWMAAISKARAFVENADAISATKTHMTAAAAAIAAAASSAMRVGTTGIGKPVSANNGSVAAASSPSSNGYGGSGNGLVSGTNSASTPDMRSATAIHPNPVRRSSDMMNQTTPARRSSEMDSLVNGTSSLFLKRNEERKLRKVM